MLKSNGSGRSEYLFTGSRDGTLKRWTIDEEAASCSATFESHVDWVPSLTVLSMIIDFYCNPLDLLVPHFDLLYIHVFLS